MAVEKILVDLDVDGEVKASSLDVNGAANISGDIDTAGDFTTTRSVTAASFIGQTIFLGSASGMINRTAAQFASDGTDKVYVGSNNYGWNDARDWATQTVTTGSPVLAYNDQHCAIICPVNVSQISIFSQTKMSAADSTMIVKIYKGDRLDDNDGNISLEEMGSSTSTQVNGRFKSRDIVGSTSVSAGQLIVVGFGKTDGGNGQKPRFNFTLTGTTA